MTRARRWAVTVAVAVAAFLAVATPASAHATLTASDPPAGSVLTEPPMAITVTFSEPVDLVEQSLRVLRADGTIVKLDPARRGPTPAMISATVTERLAPGSYVVAWAAVSEDSHPIRGAYIFSVGAPTAGAEQVIADLDTRQADPVASSWLAVGRFASYVGLAVLVGTITATAMLAPWLLRARRAGLVAALGGVAAAVGTTTMIAAQAATIAGGPFDWSVVLDTRAGRWWLAKLALVAAVTALVPARRLLDRRAGRVAGAVGALSLFAVFAAGGHAVSGAIVPAALVVTVVHLAAMTVWIGGLCLVALVVEAPNRGAVAGRLSPIALGSVAALAITGAVNAVRQLDGPGSLTGTTYGRWLLTKLVVVAAVIGVAAITRRRTRHANAALPPPPSPDAGDARAAERVERQRRLRHAVAVETVGVIAVVAVTAGLTGASPPAATAAPASVSASVVRGQRVAVVEITPPVTGATTMHVTITSLTGAFDVADEIAVTAELPDRQLGPIDIPTFPAGPNHVTTDNANFPVPGRWTITIAARYGDFDQTLFTAQITIGAR